jgi:hypothetical protein
MLTYIVTADIISSWAVTMCSGCNAGVAAVRCSSQSGGRSSKYHSLTGGATALRTYLGHTVKAMSYMAGDTQLRLHLQSASASAAAQHTAEDAAAAVEAAATWQVHQVRNVFKSFARGSCLYSVSHLAHLNIL